MHVMCDAKFTRRWFRHSNQTQEASTSPYTYTGLFPKYAQVTQTHKFVAMWDMAHVCCIRLLKPFSLHFFCGHLPLSFIKIVFLCIHTSMKTCNFFKSRPKGRKGRKHKAAQTTTTTSSHNNHSSSNIRNNRTTTTPLPPPTATTTATSSSCCCCASATATATSSGNMNTNTNTMPTNNTGHKNDAHTVASLAHIARVLAGEMGEEDAMRQLDETSAATLTTSEPDDFPVSSIKRPVTGLHLFKTQSAH